MNLKERDIQGRLCILKHLEDIGSALKSCRYFSIGRAGKLSKADGVRF